MAEKLKAIAPEEGWSVWFEMPMQKRRQARAELLTSLGFAVEMPAGKYESRKQRELIRSLAAKGKHISQAALILSDQCCLTTREASLIISTALEGKELVASADAPAQPAAQEAPAAQETPAPSCSAESTTSHESLVESLGIAHNPNENQWRVIEHAGGPMLVIAGPGSGKTATVVNSVLYLVVVKGVDPDEIMLTTFTNKAADELRSRLAAAFDNALIAGALSSPVNTSRFHIGTIDAICLEMVKQCSLTEYADFEIVDEFSHYYEIAAVKRAEKIYIKHGIKENRLSWRKHGAMNNDEWAAFDWRCASGFVGAYESVVAAGAIEKLASSENEELAALGAALAEHQSKLRAEHKFSYADVTAAALELLKDPTCAEKMLGNIRHIIVDEYQDTSSSQQNIVLGLYGHIAPDAEKSLTVVGDDDQSLYRFRGASVQNILGFEHNFEADQCAVVTLRENYRSQAGIIDACTQWMQDGTVDWGLARRPKHMDAAAPQHNETSVLSCVGATSQRWQSEVVSFVKTLKSSGAISDYNQVAFLASSLVWGDEVPALLRRFEREGIDVYAPRANLFAKRQEVLCALGCLMNCFVDAYAEGNETYEECLAEAQRAMQANSQLNIWVQAMRTMYTCCGGQGSDVTFSKLFMQMLKYEPFNRWMGTDGAVDVAHTRSARNLKTLLDCIIGYERMSGLEKFKGSRSVSYHAKQLFGRYLKRRLANGIDEYEDPEEPAPSGHVLFTTIHQAKGLEFPVVIVGPLDKGPRGRGDYLQEEVRTLVEDDEFEPLNMQAIFDFRRLYYTAFSRAQDLLVFSGIEGKIARDFLPLVNVAPSWRNANLYGLHIQRAKQPSLMHTYAYTTDVKAYETCPQRYKLCRVLGFASASNRGMQFGTLVHESAEAVHRLVMEQGLAAIPDDEGLAAIIASKHAALVAREPDAIIDQGQALQQLRSYVINYRDLIAAVVEAEVSISMVRENYILKGQIDVLAGHDGKVEIIDFKTGQVPAEDSDLLEAYHKQMCVYACLVENQTDYEVCGAKLYFPGGNDGRGALIDMAVDTYNVSRVMDEFDEVVASIEQARFSERCADEATCEACDFKHFCRRD